MVIAQESNAMSDIVVLFFVLGPAIGGIGLLLAALLEDILTTRKIERMRHEP